MARHRVYVFCAALKDMLKNAWVPHAGKVSNEPRDSGSTSFYSPLVDKADISERASTLWPDASTCLGVDFNRAGHVKLLSGPLADYLREFDYPDAGLGDECLENYYVGNSQFGAMDARIAFGLLRLWRPRRIIEVGSGYSTLLMVDVVERYLSEQTRITCVEPFPRQFLHKLADIELVERKVQDVDPGMFESLDRGDVLFIDSSHVSKTGSDVNFMVFDVLPRLKAGVHIHFHDIFLPYEYPRDWIMERSLSWNEQYLLRALLMFSADTFEVTLGCAYAVTQLGDLADPIRNGLGGTGGSFWITKVK